MRVLGCCSALPAIAVVLHCPADLLKAQRSLGKLTNDQQSSLIRQEKFPGKDLLSDTEERVSRSASEVQRRTSSSFHLHHMVQWSSSYKQGMGILATEPINHNTCGQVVKEGISCFLSSHRPVQPPWSSTRPSIRFEEPSGPFCWQLSTAVGQLSAAPLLPLTKTYSENPS